jgi:lipopolysaccharide transport system ATP-binding protein
MSNMVISVENLSKSYRLGQISGKTLSDDLKAWWARQRGQPNPLLGVGQQDYGNRDGETVWALKDVSFTVEQGEALGIIGSNGAGKSTLLKILSRVTAPTTGQVKIKGRIASLLEVGTGFHPDLTGRENIYLNGAILGMSKIEVGHKFDEIVDFSGIETYIDTPVKRYSSGMYVRLAFAVAAHLEPEILLVDEVLAVGDAAFQKKCLGKMGDVAKKGRTILFVSHNMAAIQSLCSRAIVINGGVLIADNSSDMAVKYYLNLHSQKAQQPVNTRQERLGDGNVRFTGAWVEDDQGNPINMAVSGQNIRIVATYETQTIQSLKNLSFSFSLHGPIGETITDLSSEGAGFFWETAPKKGKVICRLSRLPLKSGKYTFNVCCRVNQIGADLVQDAGEVTVENGDFFGTGKLPPNSYGLFLFDQQWQLVEDLNAA